MPWRPAVSAVDNGYSLDASGVVPRIDGFGPWPGPVQASLALANAIAAGSPVGLLLALTSAGSDAPACCGAATLFDDVGSPATFAGTSSKLYRAGSGSPASWSDVSGASYNCDPSQRWQFAGFGTTVLAVNAADAPQAAAISGGLFAPLAGGPPRAKFIRTTDYFVVLANLSTNPRMVQWSGLNSSIQWTPGINSSDVQEFSDGGPISGLGGVETTTVFQENAIRRMVFSPGDPKIFLIDRIAADRGCIAPYSVVNIGDTSLFLSRDGFWMCDGSSISPIGNGKIDQWFFDNAPIDKLAFCEGAVDPIRHRAYWAYWSAANGISSADQMLCYDWVLQEWSHAPIAARVLLSYVNPSLTLEQLDAYGTLDTLPYSLDSSYWLGKLRNPAYVGNDNILYTMSGASLNALIETADFQPIPGGRAFIRGAQLDIDAAAATLQVGTRERLPNAVAWGPEVAMEQTGAAGAHAEGKYGRLRIHVPAGQSWTVATGVTPDIETAGTL